MHGLIHKILFYILILSLGLLFSSWELHYPPEHPQHAASHSEKYHSPEKASTQPPYDYGNRTQLSAFALCLVLGFVGAHHFYLRNFGLGGLQLSFFVIGLIGFFSFSPLLVFLGFLLGIGLLGWIIADLILITVGGLYARGDRPLIPWNLTSR